MRYANTPQRLEQLSDTAPEQVRPPYPRSLIYGRIGVYAGVSGMALGALNHNQDLGLTGVTIAAAGLLGLAYGTLLDA